MDLDQEDVRNLAEGKKLIEFRISELEKELENLRKLLNSTDIILRASSFQSAAANIQIDKTRKKNSELNTSSITDNYEEIRPLKRIRDGRLLANAYISSSSLAIIPISEIILKLSTPPFNSFFINRILEGMKKKDLEKIKLGEVKEEALEYQLEDEKGDIKKIIIRNYRDENRLTEILNTSTWTFSRMLEK